MYCPTCNSDNLDSAFHCSQCGHDLVGVQSTQSRPIPEMALWNPDLAAVFSLVLSPLFGASIHALNWRRLGQRRRAFFSWLWVALIAISLLAVGAYAMLAFDNERMTARSINLASFVALVFWYFTAGRAQGKFIVREIPGGYVRKNWFVPLSVCVILLGTIYGLDALID